MAIIEDILEGKDVFVVLENRFNSKYVESYNFTTIILYQDRFWGKFANVHSSYGHMDVNKPQSLAYAYNNFSGVVCTMALNSCMQRFYSAYAYAKLNFKSKGKYAKLWDDKNGGSLSLLEEAVRSGSKMKMIIKASDDFTYIVPVHTVEVYREENRFFVESEFDGFPTIMKDFSWIKNLDEKFNELIPTIPEPAHPTTNYTTDAPFFLTSFMIESDKVGRREYGQNGRLVNTEFECESMEILAEVI